eukprot:3827996-Prymnesium_polylepis.1
MPVQNARRQHDHHTAAMLAVAALDAPFLLNADHNPLTEELLYAVRLDVLLTSLPIAFARDPLLTAGLVVRLVRLSRVQAKRVIEMDTEGGQDLLDAGARSQLMLVALLNQLPVAYLRQMLASKDGVAMLQSAVQADCTILLSNKNIQIALHHRWDLTSLAEVRSHAKTQWWQAEVPKPENNELHAGR